MVTLILVPCISFVHVVWPRGFSLGYLQVMSFYEKQLVSHLPTRHSCFPPSFLSCFLYVLQHRRCAAVALLLLPPPPPTTTTSSYSSSSPSLSSSPLPLLLFKLIVDYCLSPCHHRPPPPPPPPPPPFIFIVVAVPFIIAVSVAIAAAAFS